MKFELGIDIWEKSLKALTTNSSEFDNLLGNGFELGTITEIFGGFKTGKTQICHQLCVNVSLSDEEGGLDGNALYIDTDNTFRPERIIQMSKALDLDYKEVLGKIFVGEAHNTDLQISLLNKAPEIIEKKNIKLSLK